MDILNEETCGTKKCQVKGRIKLSCLDNEGLFSIGWGTETLKSKYSTIRFEVGSLRELYNKVNENEFDNLIIHFNNE